MKRKKEAPDPPVHRRKGQYEVFPWTTVFEFASGRDAAHAMATTKSVSRGRLAFTDEDVTSALYLRLVKLEVGKALLHELSPAPEGRFWLPKLMHIAENRLSCRWDGLYEFKKECGSVYLRFYKDGEVIRTSARRIGLKHETLVEIWTRFRRERPGYSIGRFQCHWIRTGERLMRFTFPIAPGRRGRHTDYDGELRADGGLRLRLHNNLTQHQGQEDYAFIPIGDFVPLGDEFP